MPSPDRPPPCGFDAIGIADPASIADAGPRFLRFLDDGAHGEMDWLARDPARRTDPRGLWPDVRSIIMLGVNYGPDADPTAILAQKSHAAISVYAQGDDYHDLIKTRLETGRALASSRPPAAT